jgi:colanic acid/amylovoran biosynthesis protein
MRILLMGQCTLHWGRMEFGNIGNYYIMEPLVRELHRIFPKSKIFTTFQMSEEFCEREGVEVLPMDLYYGWTKKDLDLALKELAVAQLFSITGHISRSTPYIGEVLKSDLIIDFSGDIWGDNANFLGEDRFLTGLCKDRTAQLLGKPTVMIAGSPGPFEDTKSLNFAKEVFENFALVTNREPLSKGLLKSLGFDVSNVKSLACPSFLFDSSVEINCRQLKKRYGVSSEVKKIVGFTLSGWNFSEGPFDKWPRKEEDYLPFVKAIEFMCNDLGLGVCLFSHSNGFVPPPEKFEMIQGRDYPFLQKLQEIIKKRDLVKEVFLVDSVNSAWETKSLVSCFDMVVSGRLHGAVAGLSQFIPTVMLDYGHEPKAHKTRGFAKLLGVEDYVADPSDPKEIVKKIRSCWEDREEIEKNLKKEVPKVQSLARENFELLKKLV